MEVIKIEERIIEKIDELFADYQFSFIELPIFDRNKKKNRDKREIILGSERNVTIDTGQKEELHEFDEKIFYGMLTIASLQGSRTIITDYVELIKISGVNYNGTTTKKLKETIEKLKNSTIILENIKIDNIDNRYMKIKIIEKYEMIDAATAGGIDKYKEYVRNSKVQSILELTIPELVFNEIRKIDISILSMIKGITAKKLYILLKKIESISPDRKGVMLVPALHLFSLMPLKIESKNISAMYNYLEYNFYKLKEMNIIGKYKVNFESDITMGHVSFNMSGVNATEIYESILHDANEKVADGKNIYVDEIKMELLSLAGIMKDTREIVKTLDFNKYFYKKEILTILYEKFHMIKGMAGYVEEYELESNGIQVCMLLEECIREKRKYTIGINDIITDKINKMIEITIQ